MIFSNDPSVLSLLNAGKNLLEQGQVDSALKKVCAFVERIVIEPLCTAMVFASKDLDQLCLEIGRFNLGTGTVQPIDLWPERASRPLVVYVLTRLQVSGGHSRVVEDFIYAQPQKDHLILVTGIAGQSDSAFIQRVMDRGGSIRFFDAPRGDFQSRLSWLQGVLIGIKADHVYLFNHHQDSVAVSAMQPSFSLNASFYHHADHHLCLGVHLSHLRHIDPHPMGYHNCRERLGIDNVYIPLTFEDFGERESGILNSGQGCITTATVARSNKIEVPYYISYLDLIPRLLKATGGRHLHVGRLTPWALWRLRRGLKKEGVPLDRFIYKSWLPNIWQVLKDYRVDVYLASFPYAGAITLIEAMGAGVPVIVHRHMYSSVLSCLELAYPEAFCWSDPNALVAHLGNLDISRLQKEGRLARARYERFHRAEILKLCLTDNTGIRASEVPPLLEERFLFNDEWGCWALNRIGIRHVIARNLYRFARGIRARLS